MFIATTGSAAKRLGVILLAFGAIDALAAIAAWPFAARAALLLFAFILTLQALMALVPILAFFAIRTIGVLVARTARAVGGLSAFGRGGYRRTFCRRGDWRNGRLGCGDLSLLRALLTARPMRPSFEAPGRTPHFDEGRLLQRPALGRVHLCGGRGRSVRSFGGQRLGPFRRKRHRLLHQWCSFRRNKFSARQQGMRRRIGGQRSFTRRRLCCHDFCCHDFCCRDFCCYDFD